MSKVTATNGKFSLSAYVGDAKTLLVFNFSTQSSAKNLAGFTIQCQPDGGDPYYIFNVLQFKTPADHAQDPKEPANSSINAPIHKFRWIHIPGSAHQGLTPFYGKYRYTVTPRFFDGNQSLKPADPTLAASLDVDVSPFEKGNIAVGFTRGFVQSQAFVSHFGLKALIRPKGKELQFDTSKNSGANAAGQTYSYQDQYQWLGFTARARIFEILDAVAKDQSLRLDVFAYDLNEPDIIGAFLKLAPTGNIRIILDNAPLHHNPSKPTLEDQFEGLFKKAAEDASKQIMRGHFGRYAHDKVLLVSDANGPKKVLTGSTNFSVTGMYVNSNHVLVFDDKAVAAKYADVFSEAWNDGIKPAPFQKSSVATQAFNFSSAKTPATEITFAPHAEQFATDNLDALVKRVQAEGKKKAGAGSVLFACMELAKGSGPVCTAGVAYRTKYFYVRHLGQPRRHLLVFS
jgi:hypothetical protein